MYKSISLEKFPGVPDFPHKAVWRSQVPLKISSFVWLIYHKRILTPDNLRRRGWNIVSRCVLCESEVETMDHLFRACSYSNKIWSRFMQMLRIIGPHPEEFQQVINSWPTGNPSSWQDWFRYLFLHAYTWELWKERNERTFNDKKRERQAIFHKIGRNLLGWLAAAELTSEQNKTDWLKLLYQACPLVHNTGID